MQDMTMLTSVHSDSRAFQQKEKLVRVRTSSTAEEQPEARLRLTQTLQTTLDLESILKMFFQHCQEHIKINGLTYHNEQHDVKIAVGRKSTHQCDYRLNTQQDKLGEIAFTRNKRFSEADMASLEMLLGVLIYPLRNGLQYHEALQTAMRDSLTGIGNRVALDNALHRELQLAQRYDQDLSLLVIDIDHFKQVNDTYGHSCGDEVLCQVAKSIQSVVRETDMPFRYGGEEFVVVLSKTPEEGASTIAERIRHYIEQAHIASSAGDVRTSVSIGISTLQANENIRNLFERADQALYQAKQNGRNRVVASSELSASGELNQA